MGVAMAASLPVTTQGWWVRTLAQPALSIYVSKTARQLRLLEGEQQLAAFPVVLGRDPKTTKLFRGDGRTPEGRYYVCEKRPRSRFHKFLGISYPNIADAERAYTQQLISGEEWADIFFANLRQTVPPWSTALGGRVGIHGFGAREEVPIDWTDGCIAVSNIDIDYLYDRVPVGTPVIIGD
jgi:murein L,D-transpeptidase YafK